MGDEGPRVTVGTQVEAGRRVCARKIQTGDRSGAFGYGQDAVIEAEARLGGLQQVDLVAQRESLDRSSEARAVLKIQQTVVGQEISYRAGGSAGIQRQRSCIADIQQAGTGNSLVNLQRRSATVIVPLLVSALMKTILPAESWTLARLTNEADTLSVPAPVPSNVPELVNDAPEPPDRFR